MPGLPDEATFYTSGRASNEAAFTYQLFVRAFGTNNLPDCSNMCHESTGKAMTESIGVGKSAIHYEDFEKSDLIIIMGQNPGTNHPRMLTALEDAKRAGASIVAVNPLPEAGLLNFKNPQRPRGIIGKGTDLADQYLQIRIAGDMALMQALAKRVFEAEDAAPGRCLTTASSRSTASGWPSTGRTWRPSPRRRCWPPRGSPAPRSTSWPPATSPPRTSSSPGRWA